MRRVALLVALLVSHASVAVEADDGTAPSISAICAYEFALAADRAEQAAVTADDGSPEDADGAGGEGDGEAPETVAVADDGAPDAVPAAADAPGLLEPLDLLDAAVRGCASLDEWLVAAQLYPETFGSADPQAVLVRRCADPVADLASYATCRSLAAALATPVPTLAPTPAPERTPAPDPESVATPDPKGDGSKTDTARAKKARKGRVTVSKAHVARIPTATEIRYFTIKGDTPGKLLRSNQRKGGRHCGNHQAIACVLMSWTVNVTKKVDPRSRECTIGKASTTLRSTVFLPRWSSRSKASRDLVRWWRKVLLESAVHEAKHIKIQQSHLAAFRREAKGKPCGSATILLNRHMAKANRAQAAFDRVEYQKPLPPLPVSLLR